MKTKWIRFMLCLLMLMFSATIALGDYPVSEIVKRNAADAGNGDSFGKSSALSGDFLVVGAPIDDNANGSNAGAAYVFHRNEGGLNNWGQVAKLMANDGEDDDYFGQSVAIDGDYVIVGAPYDDNDNGINAGAGYIFYRHQGGVDNWGQQAKLLHLYSPWAQPHDNCGWSVAIADPIILMGVPRNDWAGQDAGVVSCWGRSGSNWIELTGMYAEPAIAGDEFGVSVAMTDDYAVVGAWFHDNGNGAAYTYQSIGYWDQEAILLPTGAYAYQKFGASVDISGTTVIVGAYEDNVNGTESGSASIHTRSGGSWPFQTKLLASDGSDFDRFGWDVGISGSTVVVGAPDQDNSNGNYAGAMYVFGNEGGWTQIDKHLASDGGAGDWFGQSVDVEVETAVCGAPSHDLPVNGAGAVYLYGPESGPVNDDCANATMVGDVSNLPFDTGNATADGDGTCMIGPNIWFCYTATCTGVATIDLCGSGYDTMLAIYEGCGCDPLGEELCCNDDTCGLQSQCKIAVSAGHQYLIEVGGYQGETGTGVLSIECEANVFDTWPQDVTAVWQGDHQWADFDNDGDLDLVICGMKADETLVTQTYDNQDGTLVLKQDLEGVRNTGSGCLGWGDYDGDGDLDLAVVGYTNAETRIAYVYQNDGSGNLAHDTSQVLTGLASASLDWGDYDNDGDLDLVTVGGDGSVRHTIVYENQNGTLVEDSAQALTGLAGGTADWGDFDNDGDLDLIISGGDGETRRLVYFVNDPVGTLTADGEHGLPGLNLSDIASGDYDNDGDLDLAVTGESPDGPLARIYQNDGSGNFTQVQHLLNIYRSSCVWGDYDNDGDLDPAFFGYTGTSLHTMIYRNDDGVFNDSGFWFPGRYEGCISFADIDNDMDLDFYVMGYDWYTPHSEFHEKRGGFQNSPPNPPDDLSLDWEWNASEGTYTFDLSWSGASDAQTPSAGLYYCLRVGTEPGASDIVCGGYGSPLMGSSGQSTSMTLALDRPGYYWSVRSVDSGLMASEWSPEQIATGVEETAEELPAGLHLATNVPNPFNPKTQISYRIPEAGAPARVLLQIYDIAGRRVRTLVDEPQRAGVHDVFWDGRDERHRELASGVYFSRLSWRGETRTQRMVLIR